MRLLAIIAAMIFLAPAFAADPKATPRLDINNATKELIDTLPGVGPVLADAIIAGRPYRTIDDLDRVKGIGPAKLEQIRSRIFIAPMRTNAGVKPRAPAAKEPVRVNINTATQKELEQLPGIGPKRAEAIIAARPFKRPEDIAKIPSLTGAAYEKIKGLIVTK